MIPTVRRTAYRATVALTLSMAVLAAGIVALSTSDAATNPGFREQLPDLRVVAPFKVTVFSERVGRRMRVRLAFGSAGENVGSGPLLVVGHRASRGTRFMTGDQLVDTSNGSVNGEQSTYSNVGVLRYVASISPNHRHDHQHWHFVRFIVYELRRASDEGLVGPDHKTGFCLGDRVAVGRETRVARAASGRITYKDFTPGCGRRGPGLLRVVQGIDPGKADPYAPRLEGQSIDISKVPTGRYVLVHTINKSRRIRESNYENDASSVLISLRRQSRGRLPIVTVLARCPGSVTCPPHA